ncbi:MULTISPECIES: glutaredoxin family protein [Arthrobacter]|uniref:Glutaredoxin family protein n=2 Tax=Arthrobacter TaxID=1663 RepID=A0ABU9KKW3_9MICC|nr:glutaredoxin family protein [Arthrobacter sp. YJM1]MDP5227540.1 glutaredoxin family protein [Arthrobacter sp. YJM1]
MRVPELLLITKRDCHLCEAARRTVGEVAGRLDVPWRERLIDDDDALRSRFSDEVPVVLIDGVQRDFWTIDAVRLERKLREAQQA